MNGWRTTLMSLLLIGVVAMQACGNETQAPSPLPLLPMKLYESEQYPFTLQYPGDWVQKQINIQHITAYFSGKKGEELYIAEEKLPNQTTLQAYVDLTLSLIEEQSPGFQLLSRNTEVTQQGEAAEVIVFTLADDNLYTRFFYLHDNNVGFNAIYRSPNAYTKEWDAQTALSLSTFWIQTHLVSIDSQPQGATILVDRRPMNERTPANLDIPMGTRTITLTLEGYRDATEVVSSSTSTVNVSLFLKCPGEHFIGNPNDLPEIKILRANPRFIKGAATNVNPEVVRVVVWIQQAGYWYIQPEEKFPFRVICSDGSWTTWSHDWDAKVTALLVDAQMYQTGDSPTPQEYHPAFHVNRKFRLGVLAADEYPK